MVSHANPDLSGPDFRDLGRHFNHSARKRLISTPPGEIAGTLGSHPWAVKDTLGVKKTPEKWRKTGIKIEIFTDEINAKNTGPESDPDQAIALSCATP